MPFTVIRALENMSRFEVTLRNYERPHEAPVSAPRNSGSVEVNWTIPWCTSPADFNDGHRLVLRTPGAVPQVLEYSIWQESIPGDGDYVRFTHGLAGQTQYTYGDAAQTSARKLAANERGTPFEVTDNADVRMQIFNVGTDTWVIIRPL